MRLMLKFTIPVKKGNAAAADGSLGAAIEALIEQVAPEAAYFTLEQGKRAGMVIFEESDQARLATINEPMFAKLDAAIEVMPVLTIEDLRRGLGGTTP
jgi:Domain of unknown function (DUF3303)